MNASLQSILDIMKADPHLGDFAQECIRRAVKDADKTVTLLEFKLGRSEKDKRTTGILLQETIDELQQKSLVIEQTNQTLQKAFGELQEAQEQLVMSEKMASLGQLTAGIAHEINNPINFVKANAEPLKADLADIVSIIKAYESVAASTTDKDAFTVVEALKRKLDLPALLHEIDELLKGIDEGASRTAEIVKSLRVFSRLDQNALKKADMNEGLESTLTLLHSLYKDHIEVQREYGAIPEIDCYPGQVNQVFMNILSNAIQAIPGDGAITIRTFAEGETVKISIRDTGTGMSEEVRGKIFDPFFTTKEVGKGTGLGLSISYGIIEKHSGRIEVNSAMGKGTEFIITLPVHQQSTLN